MTTPHIGQRFGLLVVVSRDDSGKNPKWLCRCDCGEYRILRAKSLLSGAMRSCGCQTVRRRQQIKPDQVRFDLAESRKALADAQNALADAIQNHDGEQITAARQAFNEALKRVRDLKSWRLLAELGKGRPA
jgi:hypothetical protein